MKVGRRTAFSVLLAAAGLLLFTAACQGGLPGADRQDPAWEATREAMATRVGGTAQVAITAVAARGTATAQAYEDYWAERRGWPALAQESFDANGYEWPEDEDLGGYADVRYRVEGGSYQWEALANDSFVYWARPGLAAVSDFYLSADLLQVSGPANASMGLVFRWQDEDNYYAVLLDSEQGYAVFRITAEGWQRIADWTISSAIRPYESNRVSVLMEGPRMTVLINNQVAAQVENGDLETGKAGVLISMFNAGDEGSFAFDNFELRALPEAVFPDEEEEGELEQ
jgi:hypothetical protein